MSNFIPFLFLLFLLCYPAQALPEPGDDRPREIAGALPADCPAVLAVTLTPSRWEELLGKAELDRALSSLGVSELDWNGSVFIALYHQELVWGFDDGTAWRLVAPDSLDTEFAQEKQPLKQREAFDQVAKPWQGGPFFLYIGDLTEPGPELRAFYEEYPEAVPPGLNDKSVPVPHLSLGYQDGQLQGWIGPLAPEAKVGALWNPLLGHNPQLEKAGSELSRWSAELVEFFQGMSIRLPLEYRLFIMGSRCVQSWGKRPLPLVVLEELSFEEPEGSQIIPAVESLTHVGNGVWRYDLDRRSTGQVLGKAKELVSLIEAPPPPPTAEDICSSQLRNIGTALEMYYADHQRYPETLEALTPEYLGDLPTCPAPDSSGYGYSLEDELYVVICPGRNHSEKDYPRYTSTEGLVLEP